MFQNENNTVDDHKIQGIVTTLNNVEDLSSLLELDDVKDELNTLRKLFSAQKEVITALVNYYEIMDSKTHKKHPQATSWMENALEHVKKYIDRVKELSEDCERVEKSVCSPKKQLYK